MKLSRAKSRFLTVNLITIVSLFVLIFAGGVVRSTGSGMGCPDWPKCFGRYIPPTDIKELPEGYQEKYVAKRKLKNERFARTLDIFGYSDLALRIRNDQSILIPEDFNVAKTWTEYINRLIGVISGFLLLITAFCSFVYFRQKKRIVLLSWFNLILVGFQGWLGSIVVSTNLVAGIVTVHMLLALGIIALCIYTYHEAKTTDNCEKINAKGWLLTVVYAASLISILQITMGTEVREKIDSISGGGTQMQGRGSWVHDAGAIFTHHRDMALVVLFLNIFMFLLIRRSFSRHSVQQQMMSFIFLMIMFQIASGIALSYYSLPPAAQAIHILLATLVFSAQFYLVLNLRDTVKVWGAAA